MPEYPVLTEADEVTPAVPITANINSGEVYGPVNYWAMNDPGSLHSDAEEIIGAYLKIECFDGAAWVDSGLPMLDGRWAHLILIGTDNAADPSMVPQILGTVPIGTGKTFPLANISPGCGRKIALTIEPPGSADNGVQQWRIILVTRTTTVTVAGELTLGIGQGVLPGYRIPYLRRFAEGADIVTFGDDHITVGPRLLDYDGQRYAFVKASVSLNQNAADGALAAGQAYLAVLSQNINGTITVTKGNKAVAPVTLPWPSGEPLIRIVHVAYTGAASVIGPGDIDASLFTLGDFLTVGGTGASAKIYPGFGVSLTDEMQRNMAASLVGLTDDTANYVWELPSGAKQVTTTVYAPTIGAYPLAKITMVAGIITAIVDLRPFVDLPIEEYTIEWQLNAILSTQAVPLRGRFFVVPMGFELDSVTIDLDKVDGLWTAGNIKFDVLTIPEGADATAGGTTIYTSNATDDQRPGLAWNAAAYRAIAKYHEVRAIPKGARLVPVLIEVPTASAPEPAHQVILQLHFRRTR